MADFGGKLRLEYYEEISDEISEFRSLSFGTVNAIRDSITKSVSDTPIPTLSLEDTFLLETDNSREIWFSFKRNAPEYIDNSSSDSTKWSNSHWYLQITKLIDRWQVKTDGATLIYTPDADNPYVEEIYAHIYIKSIDRTYNHDFVQMISGTVSMIVGTMYVKNNKSPAPSPTISHMTLSPGACGRYGVDVAKAHSLQNIQIYPKGSITAPPTPAGWSILSKYNTEVEKWKDMVTSISYMVGSEIPVRDGGTLKAIWSNVEAGWTLTYVDYGMINSKTDPLDIDEQANIQTFPSGWNLPEYTRFVSWNYDGTALYPGDKLSKPSNSKAVTLTPNTQSTLVTVGYKLFDDPTAGQQQFYTIPSNVKKIRVILGGGGGGGGGGMRSIDYYPTVFELTGGGGGSGEIIITSMISINAGDIVGAWLGAGGIGGSRDSTSNISGTDGADGVNTLVNLPNSVGYTARGGAGGKGVNSKVVKVKGGQSFNAGGDGTITGTYNGIDEPMSSDTNGSPGSTSSGEFGRGIPGTGTNSTVDIASSTISCGISGGAASPMKQSTYGVISRGGTSSSPKGSHSGGGAGGYGTGGAGGAGFVLIILYGVS